MMAERPGHFKKPARKLMLTGRPGEGAIGQERGNAGHGPRFEAVLYRAWQKLGREF